MTESGLPANVGCYTIARDSSLTSRSICEIGVIAALAFPDRVPCFLELSKVPKANG